MHEMSVALEVCRIAEAHVGREQLARIVGIGMQVGDESGVEPAALEFCLEAALATPPFTGAKPVIERLPGTVLRLDYLEVDDGRPDH